MALDERSRHELHSKLREALGEPAAATLMEYLPPVGWADVATKRDVDALDVRIDGLEERIGLRFDGLEERIGLRFDGLEERVGLRSDVLEHRLRADLLGEINAAVTSQTRTMIFAVLGSNLTIAGIAFAAGLLR